MIKGVLIDLGDTIIEQRVDFEQPLSEMELMPFPDAQPALAELKAGGYLIAIVSNTFQSTAEHVARAMERLGLLRYVDTIVTSTDVGMEKPHPDMFLLALENLGLSAQEAIMVGDDIAKDIGGAQKLGIATIFVQRDPGPVDSEITPTFVVPSLRDILRLLVSYRGGPSPGDPLHQATPEPAYFEEAVYEQRSQAAHDAQERLLWDEAARLHIEAANYCLAHNYYERASSHFMRAARCRERVESWRDIGSLWLRASRALELTGQPTESGTPYEDYDASQHFFLGIAADTWDNLPAEEKIGRAYRYAGYHLEQGGTNQSAYNQYYSAGLTFEALQDWEQAGRAFYLAILSFIHQYGELNREYLQHLETALQQSLRQDEMKFLHRTRLYYRRIAAELRREGSEEDQEMMYIKHKEINRTLARKNGKHSQWLMYTLWGLTSNYGTDLWRWIGWTAVVALGLFPILYALLGLLGPEPHNWLDAVYFSVGTFIAVGYSELVPQGLGRLLALSEAVIGLFMLGSLVTLILNKTTR